MSNWRVGSKVPLNVYEGDRPVCQCHTEKDAARLVKAMNAIPRAEDITMEELELWVRAWSILKDLNARNVQDVLNLGRRGIIRRKMVGPVTLLEIEREILRRGFSFSGDPLEQIGSKYVRMLEEASI